jgi:uncharacterized membrane protein YdbT with pleckstrin-like domain
MSAPLLQQDEQVVFTAHPHPYGMMGTYLLTLGFYEFWRRATYFVVTDQRVILSKGRVTRSQRAVPIDMVQDASVTTSLGLGNVIVSTAGGPQSVERFGPMAAPTARRMAEVVLGQRRQARGPDVMDQLKKLAELRDAGVLTPEEFEAKKAELLRRLT